MNRHYSLFSSRAKVRREKFASTRKTLSESWEQSFPDEAPFLALPSPTIGGEGLPERLSLALSPLAKENKITGFHPTMKKSTKASASSTNQFEKAHPKWSPRLQIVRQLSQPLLRTAEIVETCHKPRGLSPTLSPASSSKYLKHGSSTPSYDWRDVSTQCNIFQFPQRSLDDDDRPFDNYGLRTKSWRNLRRSRSLEWDNFTTDARWESDQKFQTYGGSWNTSQSISPFPTPKREIKTRSSQTRLGSKGSMKIDSLEALHTSSSSFSASPRGFQDSFISYSPPISPRRFGLRGMTSLFSFSKEKLSGGGSPIRKKEPPTHLDLFGSQQQGTQPDTVFETRVCKNCALLMPQLSQTDEKPELMQQQTQTDFSMVDLTQQPETGLVTTTATTTSVTTATFPPKLDTCSPSSITKTVASPSTTGSRPSISASSASNICQKHQNRYVQHKTSSQEHTPPSSIIPEKKYVPSPLAAEKWKSCSQSQSSEHGPESPVRAANLHHHHHYHQHSQMQSKKLHSLAFSLPIPQVALQYANLPCGEPVPCHNPTCSQRFESSSKTGPTPANNLDSSSTEGRGKSSTLPTIDSKHIVAIRSAEKRRRFFAKKQTNSAPDTFDSHTFLNATHGVLHTTRRLCGNCKEPVTNCLDGVLRATRREKGDTSAITPPSVEVWESEIRTARCGNVAVTHVSELDYPDADPPCHFCCEQASTAIHDASRLQIVSGGLVRSRDGSARSGSAPYINLPSPNVQAENGQQSVFPSLELSPSMSQTLSPGSHYDHPPNVERQSPPTRGGSLASTCASRGSLAGSKEEEDPLVGPPASSLTRRPALVPPKLIPDPDYENDAERDKNSCRNSEDNTSPRARRSSIVVIPPMQICPGDLLVYGKCLSQRKSLLGTTIETPSPIQNMLETENTSSRKGKATWSLLKLFERGSRPKGGPSGAIEEIMSLIQPCDYSDPKLTRFKGMCWSDFVSHVANQKVKNRGSCGSVTSGSSSEGSQSNQPLTPTPLTKGPKDHDAKPENHSFDTGAGAILVLGHPTLTPTPSSPIQSGTSSPAKEDKTISMKSPKPLVRKRMGLMRTMSDRCLERRITPALFRGTQGFLMGEKLVEGKESECGGDGAGSSKKPLPIKSEKDAVGSNSKESAGSATAPPSTSGTHHQPPPEESISDPDLRQKMRQKEALWDLFQSECSFLYDHLMVLKNVFLEPLKRIQVEGIAMYAEPELLFGNLDELCGVTYAFCKEFIHLLLKLTDAAGELSTTEVLAKLFEPSSKARAMSQAYHRYALNYINALNYLETLRRQVEFTEFEKLCMKDPRCKKLQLTDLLVSPVQHIMKVPLILKDIQSRTNEPQEKELIVQILEIQENSIRELDDKMRWLKNYERLLEIQRNIVWPSILEMEPKTWVPEFLRVALSRQPCDSIIVSPRRQIIHEGLLQLWDTGKPSETYVILFDDMLLITRRKKGLSKKKSSLTENWQSACGKSGSVVGSGLETNHRYIVYRQPISLDRFFIHDIAEAENTSAKLDYAFVLVALNRFQQIVAVHTFQAPSDQVKNMWLLKLKTTQEKWKRTLQTTVFRGVRSSTDSGQSNVASSLVFGLNKQFGLRHNEA